MHISKCDICKKTLKNYSQRVSAGLGSALFGKELCLDCGKPVVSFLLRSKLVTEAEVEKLKK